MKTHHDTQASFTDDELTGWFAGRIPDDLYAGPPTITGDRDEILTKHHVALPPEGARRVR